MSSPVVRRAVLSAALVTATMAGAGCAWQEKEIAETRSGLLGLSGLDLRECLGVPTDFSVDGDVETQSYHFDLDEEDAGFEAGRIEGTMGGFDMPGERGYEPRGFPMDDDGPPPFCQLDFELTKGRVTQVAAQGRTREGLNADSTCLLRAQACIPQADDAKD